MIIISFIDKLTSIQRKTKPATTLHCKTKTKTGRDSAPQEVIQIQIRNFGGLDNWYLKLSFVHMIASTQSVLIFACVGVVGMLLIYTLIRKVWPIYFPCAHKAHGIIILKQISRSSCHAKEGIMVPPLHRWDIVQLEIGSGGHPLQHQTISYSRTQVLKTRKKKLFDCELVCQSLCVPSGPSRRRGCEIFDAHDEVIFHIFVIQLRFYKKTPPRMKIHSVAKYMVQNCNDHKRTFWLEDNDLSQFFFFFEESVSSDVFPCRARRCHTSILYRNGHSEGRAVPAATGSQQRAIICTVSWSHDDVQGQTVNTFTPEQVVAQLHEWYHISWNPDRPARISQNETVGRNKIWPINLKSW